MSIVLASASPRRLALLEQIGVRCQVLPVDTDESLHSEEDPADYVVRLAVTKAVTAAALIETGDRVVLGADTAVVLDGDTLGKPRDRLDSLAMLARLSGREHQVMTGVAVHGPAGVKCRLSVTRVRFRSLSRQECEAYWRSGEPLDKAGSYAIQGLGALFVESIDGSYSGVVGLPLLETHALLLEQGVGTALDGGSGYE